MRKTWLIYLACVMVISLMLPVGYVSGEELGADAPLAEIVPVDKLPAKVDPIDKALYAYDDLSQRTTIEILGHNYGVQNSDPDPIAVYIGEKYNTDITFNSITETDFETVISTRFAAQDFPDVIVIGAFRKNIIQPLFDQGLVIDTTLAMRYMPNYVRYFTRDYADYIRYQDAYPGAPRYQIQAEWNPFVRLDWLEKFEMSMPTTLDELLEYARKCTTDDPDGNGEADTWFAGGAGNGQSFGMLDSLRWYFGFNGGNSNQFYRKDGKISHMILDGTMVDFLAYLKTMNDEGLLSPDWYTIDWETFKSYSLNGKIGFVNYPASNIHQEQMDATGGRVQENTEWHRWVPMPPIGTGKASPAPGPSYMFVFPTTTTQDPVKFKRICHILDESLWTGDDYFETMQAGGNKVFNKDVMVIEWHDDGTAAFNVDQNTHPTWTGELDTTGLCNAGWQTIGLGGPWLSTLIPGFPEGTKIIGEDNIALANMSRWANNFVTNPDPEILTDINEFEKVELPKFVFGTRSLDDWDAFVQEWLNVGADQALTQAAEQMGLANYK